MFAAERLSKIREILLEYKHVDVATLSSILSVSEATTRRDLEKLEEEGFLKKTHGGAVVNEEAVTEVQLSYIEDPFMEEKRQIGIIAAQMVNNHDLIFLGSGNTCLQIAKNIKDRKELTVVTNSVNIILELSGCSNINLLLTGGNVESFGPSLSMVGQFAKGMLESLFVNKAFFSVNGISIKYGYTVNNAEQAEIYKILMRNADEIIVAADYTKFDKRSLTQVGPIHMVKKIITNVQVSMEYKKFFFENDIQVFTAFEDEKNIAQ
jgi:DeoR family transcriptional regulator, fructose operon transcriptional repressor